MKINFVYIELSHTLRDEMPGFRMKNKDNSYTEYSARIYPFLTHDQTKENFEDNVSFEITQVEFQTSISTYLDSPYHRFPDGKDISKIPLSRLILPAIVIEVSDTKQNKPFDDLNLLESFELENHAVLFNFNWSKYFGTEKYYSYPFISETIIDYLISRKINLVGVDTINIDNSENLKRPAHTKFLKNDILIVENLTNLDKIPRENEFTFYAIPIKAKDAAAMPVRAFAEV